MCGLHVAVFRRRDRRVDHTPPPFLREQVRPLDLGRETRNLGTQVRDACCCRPPERCPPRTNPGLWTQRSRRRTATDGPQAEKASLPANGRVGPDVVLSRGNVPGLCLQSFTGCGFWWLKTR